ncbi:GALM [Symbiodinium natans]|uniref:Aldose 1-epimerase n=1 Tax=Symbiodinium natans TaxID=878477 RepID=A0A812KZJ1_9DINO|nr:GALM [Symbiodinium natans]
MGSSSSAPAVEFGSSDGKPIMAYTLSNGTMTVRVLDLGATISSVQVPDSTGKIKEVCLGYDEVAPYLDWTTNPYFGAVAGRCANRIAKGKFTLDGQDYQLATNNGPNHLHGGDRGFDKTIWTCDASDATSITLSLLSPDGDEGYPGNLRARVTYSLPTSSSLKLEYEATTDAPTLCNLTNHAYFNLADGGNGVQDVCNHEIQVFADFYTPVDETSIPTGEVRSVSGAMDLRQKTRIGTQIRRADNGIGYDHNYVLGPPNESGLRPAARAWEPSSGRWISMKTNQPGVQFYTGNYLNGFAGRAGKGAYHKHHGFCLEAQQYPDAANRPHFPSVVLRPGEVYRQTTVYEFGCSSSFPQGPI